jgi:hypothetical protein
MSIYVVVGIIVLFSAVATLILVPIVERFVTPGPLV